MQSTQVPFFDGNQCNDLWIKSPNQRSLKQCIDQALEGTKNTTETAELIGKNCDPSLVLSDILC